MCALQPAHALENGTSSSKREEGKSIESLQDKIASKLSNREVPYFHGKVRAWTSDPINEGTECSAIRKSLQTDVSFPSKCILRKTMHTKKQVITPTIEHEQSLPSLRGYRCDIGGKEQIIPPQSVVDTIDLRLASKVSEGAYAVQYSAPEPRWMGVVNKIMKELQERLPELGMLIAEEEVYIPPYPEAIEASTATDISCKDEYECIETFLNGQSKPEKKNYLRIAMPDGEEAELRSALKDLVTQCDSNVEQPATR